MANNCPIIRAAEIARDAKKMQLEEAIALVKRLREEYKMNIQTVKDEKERFRKKKALAKSEPRVYKNNASNRRLNRVGKPIPSKKKISGSNEGGAGAGDPIEFAKPKPQRFYADNDANRKLGRAGHPIPPRKKKETTKKVEPELEKPKVVTPEINDVEPMIESDDDDRFSDDGFSDDDSL